MEREKKKRTREKAPQRKSANLKLNTDGFAWQGKKKERKILDCKLEATATHSSEFCSSQLLYAK